jgi:hypothetical protein
LDICKKRFSKQDLIKLFLVIAFPIHAWSILLVLNDAKWVAERTNSWDVIGYGSYALVVAFGESVLVFLIALLLSLITPKNWGSVKLVVVLCYLSLISATWAILKQAFYFIPISKMDYFFAYFYYHKNYKAAPYLLVVGLAVLVITSVLVPVLLFVRNENILKTTMNLFERLTVLSAFYIFLDVLGLFIIIYRNIL